MAPLAGRALRVIIAGGHHAELFNVILSRADRYLAEYYGGAFVSCSRPSHPGWAPDTTPAGLRSPVHPPARSGWWRWPPIPTTLRGISSRSGLPDSLTASRHPPESCASDGERLKRDVLGSSAGLRDWSSSLWQKAKQAQDPGC